MSKLSTESVARPQWLVKGGNVCMGDSHAYPQSYAGDPQYAPEYFSHCLCGRKKKVTTITEVDIAPNPIDYPLMHDRSNLCC